MSVTPRVQLSLKGRLLSEVAFATPQLRIGRMRENDVVVNNLAVSRFHATLRREGDGFLLEDLGSENGTLVNGERVSGTLPVTPTDVIQLGKYELRIVLNPGLQIAGAPKAKANDVWDSSQTFLAMPPAPGAPAKPVDKAVAPAASPAPARAARPAAEAAPDPEGVFAFGEEDIAAVAAAPPPPLAAEVDTSPTATPNPEHTSLFDFGAPTSLGDPADDLADAPALAAKPALEPGEAQGELYAGLIVQREGKLHQLRPWENGELCAGRAPECEIVLADAGVSRRHASFEVAPEGHVVRDLDSVNGIYVNGQRSKRHVLAVGDVVRIESFELTFVLDHQPIGSEVNAPTPAAPKAQDVGRATQFSLEAPALESEDAFELAPLAGDPEEAPGSSDDAPFEANTDGFEILSATDEPIPLDAPPEAIVALPEPEPQPLAIAAEPAAELAQAEPEIALPEADLIPLEEIDEDEKPEPSPHLLAAQPPARELSRAVEPSRSAPRLQLRLVLAAAQLSPRAREALAVLAEEGVALDARVSFEPSDER